MVSSEVMGQRLNAQKSSGMGHLFSSCHGVLATKHDSDTPQIMDQTPRMELHFFGAFSLRKTNTINAPADVAV